MSGEDGSIATPDPWAELRRFTAARIALGRAGGSMTTAELLRFRADHALARDAVHAALDVEALRHELVPLGEPIVVVQSQAADLATYLRRPELGRSLDEESRARLRGLAHGGSSALSPALSHEYAGEGEDSLGVPRADVSIVVADGLSATAAQWHAAGVLGTLVPMLRDAGHRLAPLMIARHARVALQDDVGEALHARLSLILLGERPGMGSPDSLGAYLVYAPRVGRTDAERNCVSNIRPAGLPPAAAAATLSHLITQSLRLRLSGVGLKDERAVPHALTSDAPAKPA